MSGSIPEDPPDDEPESHAERFFTTMRAWGQAEFMLDMVVFTIYRHHETRNPAPPYPAALERKLAYLLEAAEMLATVAPYASIVEEIVKLFNEDKELRNIAVHGAPLRLEDDGTVHFVVLQRRRKRLPQYTLKTFRPKHWDRLFMTSAHLWANLFTMLVAVSPGFRDSALDGLQQLRGERVVRLPADFPISKSLRKVLEEGFASGPRD